MNTKYFTSKCSRDCYVFVPEKDAGCAFDLKSALPNKHTSPLGNIATRSHGRVGWPSGLIVKARLTGKPCPTDSSRLLPYWGHGLMRGLYLFLILTGLESLSITWYAFLVEWKSRWIMWTNLLTFVGKCSPRKNNKAANADHYPRAEGPVLDRDSTTKSHVVNIII